MSEGYITIRRVIMRTFNRIKYGDTNEIKRLMKKGFKQKKQLVRNRREDSYKNNVEEWKSQGGSVGNMVGDTHWGYSPTSRSNVRPFKPQPKQLSESYGFPKPLGEIIEDYQFWREVDEIIEELERD